MKSPTTTLCHQHHLFFTGTPIFTRKPLASLHQPANTTKITIYMTLCEDGPSLAIESVTKAVNQEFLLVLSDRSFPCRSIHMLASKLSINKYLSFKGQDYIIRELPTDNFEGIDIALFCIGGSISKSFSLMVVGGGSIVVDNSLKF
ncbi:hypothetical protein Ancab_032052 [Ancistrocladus abbreviatus]